MLLRIMTAFSILCWVIICLFYILSRTYNPSSLTLFLLNIFIILMDIIVVFSCYNQN